jgi:hypothetical protein
MIKMINNFKFFASLGDKFVSFHSYMGCNVPRNLRLFSQSGKKCLDDNLPKLTDLANESIFKKGLFNQVRFFSTKNISEPINLSFSYTDFGSWDLFSERFIKNHRLSEGVIYSVILRAKFLNGDYRMLSTQFSFTFSQTDLFNYITIYSEYSYVLTGNDIDKYEKLFNLERPLNVVELFFKIHLILKRLADDYDLVLIDHLTLIYRFSSGVDNSPKIRSINKLPLSKDIVNIKMTRKSFTSKFLPLTLNEKFYGEKSDLDDFNLNRRTYINSDNNTKVEVINITGEQTLKNIYNLTTGKLLKNVYDTKISENTFSRKIDNLKLTISRDKVIKTETDIVLNSIKPLKSKDNSFNKNIGSFDIETYSVSQSDVKKIYALGFSYLRENIDDVETKIFYLKENQTSEDLVIECFNEMLKTKYNNCIFYTHNLGGYDIVFLLNILMNYNLNNNDYFKLKAILKDNKIIKYDVSAKITKTVKNKITFVDSLNLLPLKLEILSEDFGGTTKSLFPYSFVTDKTLYYKGDTPDIKFYNTVEKDIELEEYNKLKSAN